MLVNGTYSVLITPFKADESIDIDGLKQNIQFQVESGVEGIVVLGTTGEAPTLTPEEQELIVKVTVAEVNGRVPIVVGTGSYSTKKTVENSKWAEELGADALLIVTPYYNKPTQEGLYKHFKMVAEQVSLPIVVYNIQGRTGQNLLTPTLKKLMEFPNIAGVKEASGNVNQMMEVLDCAAEYRPDFKVYSGDDVLTLSLIALGGHGIFSVASNIIPKEIKALTDAALAGNFELAREIHYQYLSLFKGMFIETNPIPVKAAMNWLGFPSGPCRLPLCDLLPENQCELQKILEKLELSRSSSLSIN